VLCISHNCLQGLPDELYSLTALRDVNASYNQIDFISNSIGNMEGLHVGGSRSQQQSKGSCSSFCLVAAAQHPHCAELQRFQAV
jgi:hypothetical protein